MSEPIGLTATRILRNSEWEDDVQEYTNLIAKKVYSLVVKEAEEQSNSDYYKNRDFYVCCFFNREKNITNAPRHRIFSRRTMPGPFYHLAVWKYHHKSGHLQFMWFLPSMETVKEIVLGGSSLVGEVDRKLMKDCFDAVEGKLELLARRENKEDGKVNIAIRKDVTPTQEMPIFKAHA